MVVGFFLLSVRLCQLFGASGVRNLANEIDVRTWAKWTGDEYGLETGFMLNFKVRFSLIFFSRIPDIFLFLFLKKSTKESTSYSGYRVCKCQSTLPAQILWISLVKIDRIKIPQASLVTAVRQPPPLLSFFNSSDHSIRSRGLPSTSHLRAIAFLIQKKFARRGMRSSSFVPLKRWLLSDTELLLGQSSMAINIPSFTTHLIYLAKWIKLIFIIMYYYS